MREQLNMKITTISSAMTVLYKFVLPLSWFLGFGILSMSLWLGELHSRNGEPPTEAMRLIIPFAWLLCGVWLFWLTLRLKRVRIDAHHIYVSNYLREISVPINKIADVAENRLLNIHPVTVRFLSSTDFGNEITFMPKTRWMSQRAHSIVAQLKQLAASEIP
jgi:hypothetical protein